MVEQLTIGELQGPLLRRHWNDDITLPNFTYLFQVSEVL